MQESKQIMERSINSILRSTLINLLMRFYDPDQGQILFDGVDIREYAPKVIFVRFSEMIGFLSSETPSANWCGAAEY